MAPATTGQTLRVLDSCFVVERRDDASEGLPDQWVALVRAPDGLTIVRHALPEEPGERWVGLHSGETAHELDLPGMLRALLEPLAVAGVPVFVASTYDADLVLVPQERLDDTTTALAGAGHHVRAQDRDVVLAPAEVVRDEPSLVADERAMLTGWLDHHRATLAVKCAGLTADQLRRVSVPPSSMSLLGLVRHLAEMERGWFQEILAGRDVPPLFRTSDDPDGDFDGVATASPHEALAVWRTECAEARRVVDGAASLDVTGSRGRETFSVRWILTHMIGEYSRHIGHADLIRERIDGAVGE